MSKKEFYKEEVGNQLVLKNLLGEDVMSFVIQGLPNVPNATPQNLDNRIQAYLNQVNGVIVSKPEPNIGLMNKEYLLSKVNKIESRTLSNEQFDKEFREASTDPKKSNQLGNFKKAIDTIKEYRELFDEIVSRA